MARGVQDLKILGWLYVGYLFSGWDFSLCAWWYIVYATVFDVDHLVTLTAMFS